MNEPKPSLSISTAGIWIAICAVLAIGLALSIFRQPSLLYAWGDREHLAVLFARGYFTSITQHLLSPFSIPFQQIHLPLSWMVFIGQSMMFMAPLFSPSVLIWIALTVLGTLFLYRMQQIFSLEESYRDRWVFIGLLLVHPFFWIQLCVSPGSLLIALLAIEFLIRSHTSNSNGMIAWFSLFLTSLCGWEGLLWALLLSLTVPLVQRFSRKLLWQDFWPRLTFYGSALVPMIVLYLVISVQSGQIGGSRLADDPTLFSTLSLASLLSGEWTIHARSWLVWLSDGFLSTGFLSASTHFPLFGLLALLGLLDRSLKPGPMQCVSQVFAILLLSSLFLFAFLPAEIVNPASAPLFPLSVYFSVMGMRWIADTLCIPRRTTILAMAGLLAILQIIHAPREWVPLLEKARYYHQICHTLEEEIDPSNRLIENSVAVRFDPTVFSRLPNRECIYPVGLAIEVPFECFSGPKSGIYFDLRFAPAPALVVLYPRFADRFLKDHRTLATPISERLQEVLESGYQSSTIYNFSLYRRTVDPQEIIPQWLASAYEDGYAFESQRLPDWFAHRFHPTQNLMGSLNGEALPHSVGLSWDFERDLSFTKPIGFAFTSSPSSAYRAAGLRGAGSGNRKTASRMGTLESVPFVIEGDEMSFCANLPKDSTSTFFCLAVYGETPLGEQFPVHQVRHIFERDIDQPLMGDTFFYVYPEHIRYWPDAIRGWRVVHVLQKQENPGWQYHQWSLDPWKNRQAIWMAADRDPRNTVEIDQIIQWKRPSGIYWNFESGHYKDWQIDGDAFGEKPAYRPLGQQTAIQGYEGNYFINSFHQGSDVATGTISFPTFELKWNRIQFRIGGGSDREKLYVGLRIDNRLVMRATGEQSETMRRVVWDVSPWMGQDAQIEIADHSFDAWGHILVDDIRIDQTPSMLSIPAE